MSDLENEIQYLRDKTAENRREFLRTEVETCFISLDMGKTALTHGDITMAKKEVSIAERGMATIEHFLGQAPESRSKIEPRLAELRDLLTSLRAEIRVA
jgi:hypothetical protein